LYNMKRKAIFLTLGLFILLSAGFYFNFSEGDNQMNDYSPVLIDEKTPNNPATTAEEDIAEFLPEIVWGNKNKQQVIFTFDAGSGTHSLDHILSVLEKYGLRGTFFITGKWAEQNSDSVRRISEAGHEIFNHTYSHPYLTQITDGRIVEELDSADRIISGITGVSTKPHFRPPYGDRNNHVFQVAAEAGYRAVYWTVDALDWKEEEGFTAAQAKDRIMSNLKPGAIYLMHIGDNITGEILDEVFSEIQGQGYLIVPLSEGLEVE
ncbi:MAG: polysaccharide deacetylase family protein, partial [bacterium]|nr:polysaccharide deacetylase family protein [bacterium]